MFKPRTPDVIGYERRHHDDANRLDKAAGIARAADACAGAGFHEKGLEVALDVEHLLYEATTLLNGASLINRIARQSYALRRSDK